jgi:LysM repeat protein
MIVKLFIILLELFTSNNNITASAKLWPHTDSFTQARPDSFSFCGERIPVEIPDVKERLEDIYYARTGNDDRIFLQLKRMRKYFPFFEKVLKEMGAPEDLKYLSVAESSLRIDAYSNADAAGLWQFIPSTAKFWGLRVDKQVDERFHVEKSTRAAIQMLKSLREALGSWSLAAAAYNTGQANINRVVKEQKTDNYFDLFLNKETRNYIFHIAVMKEILEHPKRYGYELSEQDYYKPFDDSTQRVTVKGPISDLGQWAKEQNTSYKIIKLYNYWIMRNTLPEGNWELILPDKIKITETKPDTSLKSATTDESELFIIHTVHEGESLTRISKQYDVRMSDIIRWNELRSDVVFIGAKLKIQLAPFKKILHTVREGDSLIRLAERYRVSAEQIKEWNKLTGNVVFTGAQLVIYAGSGVKE